MAIRDYAGTARPIDDRYESDPNYRRVEVDDPDGSLYRGYEHRTTKRLVSLACMQVSPARQAALDLVNAATAQAKADDSAFLQDLETLAIAVRDNTATAAQQRRCIWKLFRAVRGLLRD